jgi:hypothetical protein
LRRRTTRGDPSSARQITLDRRQKGERRAVGPIIHADGSHRCGDLRLAVGGAVGDGEQMGAVLRRCVGQAAQRARLDAVQGSRRCRVAGFQGDQGLFVGRNGCEYSLLIEAQLEFAPVDFSGKYAISFFIKFSDDEDANSSIPIDCIEAKTRAFWPFSPSVTA